jgi:hypothetical protein
MSSAASVTASRHGPKAPSDLFFVVTRNNNSNGYSNGYSNSHSNSYSNSNKSTRIKRI